jgi:hypothetical protein
VAPAVALPVPEEPIPEGELVAHLRELTFEQSLLMGHPGFFAYICGAGTVPGAAAELLAAGLTRASAATGSARARPRSRCTSRAGWRSASGYPRARAGWS